MTNTAWNQAACRLETNNQIPGLGQLEKGDKVQYQAGHGSVRVRINDQQTTPALCSKRMFDRHFDKV